jgi:uracil-DNA glycosylase
LSVVEGKPGSHSKIGWEKFTDLVISEIQKKGSIIFLLWGNYAKTKKSLIGKNNYVLEAAHPSPLSAHNGFFGCKHFSKANKILLKEGIKPIDWQLDE